VCSRRTRDPRLGTPCRLVPPECRVTGDDGEIKEEETSESIKLPGKQRAAHAGGAGAAVGDAATVCALSARGFRRLYLGFVVGLL